MGLTIKENCRRWGVVFKKDNKGGSIIRKVVALGGLYEMLWKVLWESKEDTNMRKEWTGVTIW